MLVVTECYQLTESVTISKDDGEPYVVFFHNRKNHVHMSKSLEDKDIAIELYQKLVSAMISENQDLDKKIALME